MALGDPIILLIFAFSQGSFYTKDLTMRKLSDTDIMEMFIQPKNVTMCQDIEAAFIHGEDSLDELCRIRYGVLDLHNGTLFITGKDQGDTFIFYVKCQDRGCFTQCF